MPINQADLIAAISKADAASDEVRKLLVAEAARDIVDTAAAFDPDTEDFRDAIHADGPDGIHALIVVEDRIAETLRGLPKSIDAMRGSIEWDEQVRGSDASRAALAVVNESLEQAEKLWDERIEAKPAQAYR